MHDLYKIKLFKVRHIFSFIFIPWFSRSIFLRISFFMVLVLHSPGFSRSRFFIFQVQGPGPGFRRSLIKYPCIMDLKVDLFTSTKRLFQTFKPIFNIDSIYHKKIELKVNLLCKSLYPVGIQSIKITKKKKCKQKKNSIFRYFSSTESEKMARRQ